MTRYRLQPVDSLPAQQGAALIILFLAILMTGAIFVVTNLAIDKGRTVYEETTTQSLAKAKEALIAYAVTKHQETGFEGLYGFLPCPDRGTSGIEGASAGVCNNQYANTLGRLPWRTLNIEPLKDASGQCLWYAVTGDYKFGNDATRSEMHNEDSPGRFVIRNESDVVMKGADLESRVVAVVIAPGPTLQGQVKANPVAGNECAVPSNVAVPTPQNYLDALLGRDNSAIVTNVEDENYHLITPIDLSGANLNDRMITITAEEIFSAIRRQNAFQENIEDLTDMLAQCVRDYGQAMFIANGGAGSDPACQQCNTDCDTAYQACLATTSRGQGRCQSDYQACQRTCRRSASCTGGSVPPGPPGGSPPGRGGSVPPGPPGGTPPGQGGGGTTVVNLPWAALTNLNGSPNGIDYRLAGNYDDANNNLFGRFPFDIANSHPVITTAVPYAGSLFNHCVTVLTSPPANDLTDLDYEFRRLYEHWKDHFFYAVSQDFAPNGDGDCSPAANCITYNLNGTNFPVSAIVFYSGERQNNQLRRAEPPANPINDANSKGIITNYLESGNYPTFNISGSNDYAACIDTNNAACACESLDVLSGLCP